MFPEISVDSPTPTPLTIGIVELTRRLEAEHTPLLVEVLGPAHFAAGHLPGALNLPLEGFAKNAPAALPDKSAEIVVYCASQSCRNSDLAARQLSALGYSNVRVFSGGKASWLEAGRSLVTG